MGTRAGTKQQPPVPLSPRLLVHMRRWLRPGIAKNYFVEWQAKPVASVKSGRYPQERFIGCFVG